MHQTLPCLTSCSMLDGDGGGSLAGRCGPRFEVTLLSCFFFLPLLTLFALRFKFRGNGFAWELEYWLGEWF